MKTAIRIRLIYALLILIVIILGLLSRKTAIVPLIVGDILYAVMMFLIIRFWLLRSRYRNIALISLSICYLIEISQLYSAPWIDQIRSTTLGALVLGRGFLWSDMLAYTIGVAICMLTTPYLPKQKNTINPH
jgi:CDP-diglyceride synthetase